MPEETWQKTDMTGNKDRQVGKGAKKRELLRTPSAIEGQGGAISEKQSRERGRMLQVRDQMAQLAAENGLKVSGGVAESLLPTTTATDFKGGSVNEATAYGWEERGYSGGNLSEGIARLMLEDNLLPTPNTMEHREIKTPEQIAELKQRSRGGYRNLREEVIHQLPTPTTQDGKNTAGPSQYERNTKPLNVEAALLATPQARDSKGRPGRQQDKNLNHDVARENIVTKWGKFEPAIRRWEQAIGRSAPAPTKADGKDGNHRLNSAFTEWMMGLPEGWVTDVGLSRNDELKACGNGVVPQQAELALRLLLQGKATPTIKTGVQLPTPTPSDTFSDRLKSSQQKDGSMHSVTLSQAVRMVDEH